MIAIQVKNSYRIWLPSQMKNEIRWRSMQDYHEPDPEKLLNRTYRSMYIEWWLHNIGYFISLPLKNEFWKQINKRCMHVDLEKRGI